MEHISSYPWRRQLFPNTKFSLWTVTNYVSKHDWRASTHPTPSLTFNIQSPNPMCNALAPLRWNWFPRKFCFFPRSDWSLDHKFTDEKKNKFLLTLRPVQISSVSHDRFSSAASQSVTNHQPAPAPAPIRALLSIEAWKFFQYQFTGTRSWRWHETRTVLIKVKIFTENQICDRKLCFNERGCVFFFSIWILRWENGIC